MQLVWSKDGVEFIVAEPGAPVPEHDIRMHAGRYEHADTFDLCQAIFEPGFLGKHDGPKDTTALVRSLD